MRLFSLVPRVCNPVWPRSRISAIYYVVQNSPSAFHSYFLIALYPLRIHAQSLSQSFLVAFFQPLLIIVLILLCSVFSHLSQGDLTPLTFPFHSLSKVLNLLSYFRITPDSNLFCLAITVGLRAALISSSLEISFVYRLFITTFRCINFL